MARFPYPTLIASAAVAVLVLPLAVEPAEPQSRRARQVQVLSLDNISLGRWNGFSDLRGRDEHCVGSRPGIIAFSLRATGSGPRGSLVISNGISRLAMNVTYNDGRGSGWQALVAGRDARGFQSRPLSQCRRGRNPAAIRLFISRTVLGAATPGRYRGEIALTIVPE